MPELRVVSTPSPDVPGQASDLVGSLRTYFERGSTKPLAWRLSQMDALEHLLRERERDILAALRADLGKPETEAYSSEIGMIHSEIRLVRRKLASWMKPERVRTPLVAMPGRSYVHREPLGVSRRRRPTRSIRAT